MSLLRQSLRALKAVPNVPVARAAGQSRSFALNMGPDYEQPEDSELVIPRIELSLEFCLPSPPPMHQFEEAPIVIETYGDVDPYH